VVTLHHIVCRTTHNSVAQPFKKVTVQYPYTNFYRSLLTFLTYCLPTVQRGGYTFFSPTMEPFDVFFSDLFSMCNLQ